MPFYRKGTSEIGSKSHGADWIEYTVGQEPAELKALLDVEAQVQLIAHFKSLYLGVVQDKLTELDYDSLATVKLWEGDATFGAEATKILNWYKSIIAYNYTLMTDVGDGIVEVPDDATYVSGIPVYV